MVNKSTNTITLIHEKVNKKFEPNATFCSIEKIKSSCYSLYNAEACMSGAVLLRGLARGQHSSEETSQRWRVVGDTEPIWPAWKLKPSPPAPIACALSN